MVELDLQFNRFSVQELTNKLPGIKHFWVGKLVETKIALHRLEERKKELTTEIQTKIKPEIGLSKNTISNIIQKDNTLREISEKIEEYRIIIEYLDHVVKIFYQSSYDIKNYIETLKLEEVVK